MGISDSIYVAQKVKKETLLNLSEELKGRLEAIKLKIRRRGVWNNNCKLSTQR